MKYDLALIGCGARKQQQPCKASELYTGALFQKSLLWALRRSRRVYILSAKYGLVDLERVLIPYNTKLTDLPIRERKAWGANVTKAIQDLSPEGPILALAGNAYLSFLSPPLTLVKPLDSLGIGKRLSFLTKGSLE